MRLSKRGLDKSPEMQISPMIDMMFLMLIFFIFSTMFMAQIKTIAVKMPVAKNSITQNKSNIMISIKENGEIYLEDNKISMDALIAKAKVQAESNKNVAAVIRADKKVAYGTVVAVLDKLKGAGVTRFGMATESGETNGQ